MTDRELFVAALDHPDPADRAAWLDQACAGDSDRRRRVDVLLKAHDDASRFLADPARPPGDSAGPDDPTRTAHSGDETTPATAVDVQSLLKPADKPGLLGTLGHYEVIEVVGAGGMGVVLKAFDPKLHRLVAVKVMAPHLAANGAARARFIREARAVAAVRNEHVVALHAVETDGPTPFLVMEFIGGISLQDRLERSGPLEVKEILRIGVQTARGLAAAHVQGIVHRDIKPANILLENGVERVKITDFGLARAADDANLTQSGVITGTPNYMSPEQATASATPQSDLFSLGAVLYALCTGHPPFRAETPLAVLRRVCDDPVRPPPEVNPDVPEWLDAIVRKLLAKNPADRFQTATEVADLLGQHLAHLQQPDAVPIPAAIAVPADAAQPVVIRVRATGTGRRISLAELMRGRVGEPTGLQRLFAITSPLADAADDVIALARSLDPDCRVDARQRAGTAFAFDVVLTGRDFEIRCAQRLVRVLKVEDVGRGESFDIIVTVRTPSPALRARVLNLLRSKYSEVADTTDPADTPAPAGNRSTAAGVGCVAALAGVVGLALMIGFRDSIWNGFVKTGYFTVAYMLGVSAVLAMLFNLGRRKSESGWVRAAWVLALVILVVGTVGALGVWREDMRRFEKVSRALDVHTLAVLAACAVVNVPGLVRWLARSVSAPGDEPKPGTPAQLPAAGPGTGWLAVIGLLAAAGLAIWMQPSFWEGYFRPGYYAPLSMLVSSGLFLAVLWWSRSRLEPGPYRRALGLAMIAIVLGTIGGLLSSWGDDGHLGKLSRASTWDNLGVMAAALIVTGTPVARWVARGRAPRASRVAVGGAFVAVWIAVGAAYWAVATGRIKWEPPNVTDAGDDRAYLRVIKEDQDAEVVVERPGERIVQSAAGGGSINGTVVPPDTAFTLSIRKRGTEVYTGVVRVKAGERREIRIPPIAVPESTVYLKPTAGSFPSDVMRMEFTPDRSAVAVERFDGPILVFDVATGRERFTLERPKSHCTAFGFSPDGKHLAYLASVERGGHVLRIADARDGTAVEKDLKPQPGRAFSNSHALAFSPDGNRLAVSAAYNTGPDGHFESQVLRWELGPGGDGPRELDPLTGLDETIEAVRFTGDGSEVLAVSGTNVALGWSWEIGKESRRYPAADSAIYLVATGREHEAVAGWNKELNRGFVVDWSRGVFREEPPHSLPSSQVAFGSLAFSADDRLIAAGTKGAVGSPWEKLAAVHIWDRKVVDQRAILLGHTDWPLAIAFDPAAHDPFGPGLVTAGKDGTVRTWRLP
jgi:tRNA A-37 threonylcarbamoyl transferase component Bud32